jgi:uncharacterized DUF497 family protein
MPARLPGERAVEFEWDEEKRREILARRGVDLLYAALIFEGEVLTRIDDRRDYGEERGVRSGGFPWAWSTASHSLSCIPSGWVPSG